MIFFKNNCQKIWSVQKNVVPLHRFRRERALSSAGSERLPYKQRVGGSNPSAPTTPKVDDAIIAMIVIHKVNDWFPSRRKAF